MFIVKIQVRSGGISKVAEMLMNLHIIQTETCVNIQYSTGIDTGDHNYVITLYVSVLNLHEVKHEEKIY